MFNPQRTTEDLVAVPTEANNADKLNVHKDVIIRKGTIVWACDVQADRWVIAVDSEGHRRQFVSFRNPFGITRGELLGPKFALASMVKCKVAHDKVPKGQGCDHGVLGA